MIRLGWKRRTWYGLAMGVVMMTMSTAPAPVYASDPDCPPPCLEDNPDYDPDDSSSEPCIKLTGPIDGEPCKECKDGEVENKPEGTEIPDDPCKECDGSGGTRQREGLCRKVYGDIVYGAPKMFGPAKWYNCGSEVREDSTCPSGYAVYSYDCFGTREYRPYCEKYWYEGTDPECIDIDCPPPGCEFLGWELVNDYTVPETYYFFECLELNPGEEIG